jgi:serine protein kinase
MDFLKNISFQNKTDEFMTLEEYLELAKSDKMAYAHPAERMLHAIGNPITIDTSKDERLARIFSNKTIKTYESFSDFYGMEDTIDRLVSFFKHAAQGLEERRQILYLLGPVGGGKSSLAERIKSLAEKTPVYCLAYHEDSVDKTEREWVISPVFESPMGLFKYVNADKEISKNYKIPSRYFKTIPSPWVVKRINKDGNLNRFGVMKIYPDQLRQRCIMKTEPSDENNQDVSQLVGKVDLRKLDKFSQSDSDAYSFSGALCRGNQGIVEMVEIWKAPIKTLHPLLTATQEGNYVGTEEIGAIPFQGIVIAHSNESEWAEFHNNSKNEAFLDRIYTVKVPYCLRIDEEIKIYEKMLFESSLSKSPCAPKTLETLAAFSVLSRLKEHNNSKLYIKMQAYNGENMRDIDVKAKSIQEYRDSAGVNEGMDGFSTRSAFKILSRTFNYDHEEEAADPAHLLAVLKNTIKNEQYPKDKEDRYNEFIQALVFKYIEFIGKEIQKAYLEAYNEYGQSLFDLYVTYADAWIQNIDHKDPDTGETWDREILNTELEKMEKAAGIPNPKDFRNEVVNFVLRAERNGAKLKWTDYEKLKEIIEARIFSASEDMLPIISFGSKKDGDTEEKHEKFVERMMSLGYTRRQVRRTVDFYLKTRKNN